MSRSLRATALLSAAAGAAGLTLLPVAVPASAAPGERAPVVVLLRDQHLAVPASPSRAAERRRVTEADQAGLVRGIKAGGGKVTRVLHVVNAVAAEVSAAERARLAADPQVAAVVPDRLVAAPRRASLLRQERAGAGASTGAAPADAAGAAAAAPGKRPSYCPADPAKPLLEPEALQQTHTAFGDPSIPDAHDYATGAGVRVAFLADGVDVDHPDFVRADGSKVFVDYRDFSGDGPRAVTSGAEAMGDASGIAAQGRKVYDLATFVHPSHPLPKGCTIRVLGMAPGASLVGLKVFPAGGFAFNSAILAALDHAVTVDHVDVVNESFGSNQFPDTNDDPTAVFNEILVRSGVTVVASSGDAGQENTVGSPATTPGVISVAGTTSFRSYAQTGYYGFPLSNGRWTSDNISALSSGGITQTGTTVDLAAPGDLDWALCSTKPWLVDCLDNNDQPSPIQQFGGTSQSAPLTAGAAALVIQAYKDTHGGQRPPAALVEQILTSTADDLGLPASEQGAGQLNSLRAVLLARSLPGSSVKPGGSGLLADTSQLALVGREGAPASARVRISNPGKDTRTLHPRLRDQTTVLRDDTTPVVLSPESDPVTVSPFGADRSYRKVAFTVPAGASRLAATVNWPDPSQIVRLVLLDPAGTLTAYSLPQGLGSFAAVDVRAPEAGRWTAILMTTAKTGFAGAAQLRTTSFATRSVGRVTPGTLVIPPGGTGTVTVTPPSGTAGDAAYALQLDASGSPAPVIPVVRRTLVATAASGGSFSGTFTGGNGRGGVPQPARTVAFDVPSGARDLSLDLTVGGDGQQAVYGFLVDPNGQPVSERTNQLPGEDGVTYGRSLSMVRTAPQPGRWTFTFSVFGPVSGTAPQTAYSGSIRFGASRVSSSGLPRDAATTLKAGKPVTATLTLTNTGAAPRSFFADARLAGKVTLPLVGRDTSITLDPAPVPPFPAFTVPTETDAFSVSAKADHPVLFEVSPFPADQLSDLAFEGDPDVIAGPAGLAPSVTVSSPVVAPQTWLALPTTLGPFPTRGPKTTVRFAARVHTRPFDPAVTSSTGNPQLATVDAAAPAATPVAVAPGKQGTITVTLTPSGARGTVVRGTLFVATTDPVTGSTDEYAALPYSYRIG